MSAMTREGAQRMRTYKENVYSKIFRLQKDIRKSIQEAEVSTYASGAAFFLFVSIIPMIMILSHTANCRMARLKLKSILGLLQ